MKQFLARISLVLVGLATMAPSCGPPIVNSRAVLVERDGAGFSLLSISGSVFLGKTPTQSVTLTFADATTQVIGAESPQVRLWTDSHIVIDLPPNPGVAQVRVKTKLGTSANAAQVDRYRFDDYDLHPVAPGSEPIAMAADDHGRVWADTEFHLGLAYWDPNDDTLHPLESYSLPETAIFLFGSHPIRKSIFGESVTYDGHGRMWFTEGGGEPSLAEGSLPNHSRLIAVDTTTLATRVLAVPGNRNGVVGVAWDETRGLVWFTQISQRHIASGDPIEPAKLISFDPDLLPFEDSDFDWMPTATCDIPFGANVGVCANATYHPCAYPRDCILAERICPPGAPEGTPCYREHPLPANVGMPAEIAVYADGSVWYTNYFAGGELARLTPETGVSKFFPLSIPTSGFGVGWPWDLRIAFNGDILAYEYASEKVARLKPSFFEQDCSQLVHPDGVTSCDVPPGQNPWSAQRDPKCHNPCIEETKVPGTLFLAPNAADDMIMSHGYLRADGQYIRWPPLLSIFPTSFTPDETYGAGLGAVSYVSPEGVIWGADYWGRRLTRLTPLPPSDP